MLLCQIIFFIINSKSIPFKPFKLLELEEFSRAVRKGTCYCFTKLTTVGVLYRIIGCGFEERFLYASAVKTIFQSWMRLRSVKSFIET